MDNRNLDLKGHVELIALPMKFLSFNFACEEDLEKEIELGPWFLKRKEMVLKRQHKGFKPKMEKINLDPTCISLPNLPPEYWHMRMIARIANSICELISIKRATRNQTGLIDARCCVNIDITKELLKEVDLIEEDKQMI